MDVLRPRPPHLSNASYFYFSDLPPSVRAACALETLALAAVFLVSMAANVAAMFLVSRKRRLLANETVLTLNLFLADLLFVCMIPLMVAVRWTVSWRLSAGTCRAVLYVVAVSGCVTISTLASISVERVLAILSLKTPPTLNPRMVGAAVGCVWAFSALTSMPLSLFFTVLEVNTSDERGNVHICALKWPDVVGEIIWNVVFISLCFFLPGLVIVLSYSKILHILQMSKSYRRRSGPRQSPSVSRQDIKLFRTLLVLMLSFLVMWSPIFIVTFLVLVRSFGGHLPVSSTTFFWVIAFTLTNSALNPILYSVCQSRRGAWRRACCCGAAIAPLKRPSDSGGERQQRGPTPPQASAVARRHRHATTDVASCGVTGK